MRTLEDEHDIARDNPALDAFVVSPETAHEVEEINDERRERGLDPIYGVVLYVLVEDSERISSTRIVNGSSMSTVFCKRSSGWTVERSIGATTTSNVPPAAVGEAASSGWST